MVSCQLSWNAAYKYLACDYCMRPLETAEENVRRLSSDQTLALPFLEFCPTTPIKQAFTRCPECGINYCSEMCRLEAFNKFHNVLCLGNQLNNLDNPLNKLNETWKKLHYPPETCTIMLIARILAMIKQSSNRDEIFSKFSEFQSMAVNENLMIFHKLLGENFSKDLERLFQLTLNAFPGEEYQTVFN